MCKTIVSIVLILTVLFGFAACGAKKNVTIEIQKEKIAIEVPAGATVEKILEAAQVTLAEKDVVEPELTAAPEDGAVIRVSRWASVKIVTADGKEKTVELTGATVADALKHAGITLADGESLNVAEDAYLSDLTEDIVVASSYKVKVTADGKTTEYESKQQTVKEFLSAEKITVGEKDRVTPAQNEKIKSDTEIVIVRVTEKTETKTEQIAYETKKEYSDSMYDGESDTKQNGVNGEKTITYRVVYADGKEESREVVSEKITKEPVDEIVVYGTKTVQTTAPVTDPPVTERTIVSKVAVPDCDGSGHGYYVVTYSDGSVEYEDY